MLDYEVSEPLVTHSGVLIEVMDALCAVQTRPLAIRFWEEITLDPELAILPLDDDLLADAAKLYCNREDKEWSMTDCNSFVIMTEGEIEEALTGDHHFEQAGFRILF